MADEKCTQANHTIKYIWIEFLNPGDGIAFHHVATKCGNGIQWENLLTKAAVELNYEKNEIGFPVPDLQLDGAEVIWEKNLPEVQLIRGGCVRSGKGFKFYGNVGYPNFTSFLNQKSWIHDPVVNIATPDGIEKEYPHVYILSGHGGLGRVFGEIDGIDGAKRSSKNKLNLGETSLNLIEFNALRILIVPACTQAAYCRGEDWKVLMRKTECFAVLGYDGKYPGSFDGISVMEKFITMISFGETILNAWKKANESVLTWGAFFLEGSTEYTVKDILYPKGKLDKSGNLLHYSSKQNRVEYQTPSMVAMFREYKSDDANCEKLKANFIADDFRKNIEYAEVYKRNYLAQTKSIFCIKKTNESEFEPGTIIYFRFFLFRPDHPDNFSLEKIFNIPADGIWKSVSGDGSMQTAAQIRDDLICCTVTSKTKCLQFVLEFNSSSLEYLKKAMGTSYPALSVACYVGKIESAILKKTEFWCTQKVIDLRILSLQFNAK